MRYWIELQVFELRTQWLEWALLHVWGSSLRSSFLSFFNFFFHFQDKVSLCSSPCYPGTGYIDQGFLWTHGGLLASASECKQWLSVGDALLLSSEGLVLMWELHYLLLSLGGSILSFVYINPCCSLQAFYPREGPLYILQTQGSFRDTVLMLVMLVA